jgi:SAM-dependent methyltransferase
MTATPGKVIFNDGAAYEQFMGKWSRSAGEKFLAWLGAPAGLRWVDVGCGNGAFTQLIVERCAPLAVCGIDPSEGQIAYARTRMSVESATFRTGDAMALPFAGAEFDVATMALVLFFVPEPQKGVAEMARVVRPGALVASYAWDILGGGFPAEAVFAAMIALGMKPPHPPQAAAVELEASRALWRDAGLEKVETTQITVERTFDGVEDYWATALKSPAFGPKVKSMPPDEVSALKAQVLARLTPAADGRLTCQARANAIKGRKPG